MPTLENIMPNFNEVKFYNITLFFSYNTVIAFNPNTSVHGLIVSENQWSKTTEKHLKYLEPDKTKRLPHKQFEKELSELMIEKGI